MNNDWVDIDVLEDYLDGKLDGKAMHFVERQVLEDPFVAEALEGLKQSPKRKQTLSILQKQLYHRVSEMPIKRRMWGITTQRLSIAATATVAFIAVSILFFMRETNRRNEMAVHKAKGVMVNLDTNGTLAALPQKPADTSMKMGGAAKTALLDKAISKIKTGDLAKNEKSVPDVKRTSQENETSKVNYTASSNTKAETFSALKMDSVESVAVSAVPIISGSNLVYRGNVVKEQNGMPVSGAVVKLAGTKRATTTDAYGNFNLPVDSNSRYKDLIVNAVGYKEGAILGLTDPNALKIALSGDLSLNQMAAITGSNGRKKENIGAQKVVLLGNSNLEKKSTEEITKPIPVLTIDYEKYLEQNNKLYNPQGPVQYVALTFKVKKDGRPTAIKVVKSLNKQADAEAKRLIEQGPDWVLPKNGNDAVDLRIKF